MTAANIPLRNSLLSKFLLITCVPKKFSSTNHKSSYVHRIGSEPLKYMNVGQLLKSSALKFGNREALVSVSENTRITFSEALYKADHLACGLLSTGLIKGDRVAIWAPNYEFWYISLLAIARAGLICVAINPAYTSSELDYCLKKVNAKSIIMPEVFKKQKHYEIICSLLPGLENSRGSIINNNTSNSLKSVIVSSKNRLPGTIDYDDLMKHAPESDILKIQTMQESIDPDSGCNIQFTSGTTGKSKAAFLSHFSLVNNGNEIGKRQELNEIYGRICLNNPFFHVYGIVVAIMNSLNHGCTLVMPAPHFDPAKSLVTIAKESCNVIYGTPTMFVDMIAKQRELNVKLPEIFFANTGGANSGPQLVSDMENILNVTKVRSIYGLTESTATVFQTLQNCPNSIVQEYVGCLGDHIEAKIIDSSGNTVPFGQPGELCLRGYATMLEYLGDKEKTNEILSNDKWLKTGDQFILMENGFAKIVGRLKEMINRGGENLFPREIEEFLNMHPRIKETHVIGVPDERMGEEVCAFISLKDPSKPEVNHSEMHNDIKMFCSGKISHFKVPRYIIQLEHFPRTVSGKVQKYKLLEIFMEKNKTL